MPAIQGGQLRFQGCVLSEMCAGFASRKNQ
jgi:hypothetical protein